MNQGSIPFSRLFVLKPPLLLLFQLFSLLLLPSFHFGLFLLRLVFRYHSPDGCFELFRVRARVWRLKGRECEPRNMTMRNVK